MCTMSTVYTPGFTFGSGVPPPKEKERFYRCDMHWNGWTCYESNPEVIVAKRPDTLASKLIPLPSYVPRLLEKQYVRHKVLNQSVSFQK